MRSAVGGRRSEGVVYLREYCEIANQQYSTGNIQPSTGGNSFTYTISGARAHFQTCLSAVAETCLSAVAENLNVER